MRACGVKRRDLFEFWSFSSALGSTRDLRVAVIVVVVVIVVIGLIVVDWFGKT